jgi:hypothetical protein
MIKPTRTTENSGLRVKSPSIILSEKLRLFVILQYLREDLLLDLLVSTATLLFLTTWLCPRTPTPKKGEKPSIDSIHLLSSIEGSDMEEWVVGTRYHPKDLYANMLEMQ